MKKLTTLLTLLTLTSLYSQDLVTDTGQSVNLEAAPKNLTLDLSAHYIAEVFLDNGGEVKGGFGLRGRAFYLERYGLQIDGMSLTPRDSIVDRADVTFIYNLPLSEKFSLIPGIGYGANFEDNQSGPGIALGISYALTDNVGIELNARYVRDDELDKLLITIGGKYEF